MPNALRLYRFADAPPDLQALSDLGGGEVLLCVAPAAWLDEDDVVLVLALLCGLLGVVWALYVLAP